MTKTQELKQCDGPHRPSPRYLAAVLDAIPAHHEVRAVSIKGQGGGIFVETIHEGMDQVWEFPAQIALPGDDAFINVEGGAQ